MSRTEPVCRQEAPLALGWVHEEALTVQDHKSPAACAEHVLAALQQGGHRGGRSQNLHFTQY